MGFEVEGTDLNLSSAVPLLYHLALFILFFSINICSFSERLDIWPNASESVATQTLVYSAKKPNQPFSFDFQGRFKDSWLLVPLHHLQHPFFCPRQMPSASLGSSPSFSSFLQVGLDSFQFSVDFLQQTANLIVSFPWNYSGKLTKLLKKKIPSDTVLR